MGIDLNVIFKKAELSQRVILVIEPLSPVSMVSDIPGSHYKTAIIPSKFHICGLFENILGWHIGAKDRREILSFLKNAYKKNFKINLEFAKSNSGYEPLVHHLFDFDKEGVIIHPSKIHFDDLWKKAFRRVDASVHPKGTPNIDHSLIKVKRSLPRKADKPDQIDDKAFENLFKENIGKFPFYYTTLASREYILAQGSWQIPLQIDNDFLTLIQLSLGENSVSYMGTNDSWIEINIITL